MSTDRTDRIAYTSHALTLLDLVRRDLSCAIVAAAENQQWAHRLEDLKIRLQPLELDLTDLYYEATKL
jgi:hypothetical protein